MFIKELHSPLFLSLFHAEVVVNSELYISFIHIHLSMPHANLHLYIDRFFTHVEQCIDLKISYCTNCGYLLFIFKNDLSP